MGRAIRLPGRLGELDGHLRHKRSTWDELHTGTGLEEWLARHIRRLFWNFASDPDGFPVDETLLSYQRCV